MPETHVHNINTDIMPAKRLKTGLEKTNGFANGGLHQNGNQNGNHNANQNGISGKRKNQFGELSDGQMTLNDWVTQWDKGRTKFHRPSVHPMLDKHVDLLVDGKDKPRCFLPLCGKSIDLKWLLDRGYDVVGCEIAEIGIKQFFEEHSIAYKTETVEGIGGTVYKGVDKDIAIYACDFFKLTSAIIGEIDCIWDRGSMAAINPEDRQRYADVITGVLKTDGRYLLDMFQLEHDTFVGPPHNFEPEEAQTLYGQKLTIKQVEHKDSMGPWQKTWGTSYFYENVFLLTPK